MALTLPSSNGNSLFFNINIAPNDNGQINSPFNGGLTKTTATLTPTRLKNIEEQFLEQSSSSASLSLVPPKPFLHDHMAGFVPPTVNARNIKLNVSNISISAQAHQPQTLVNNSFDFNNFVGQNLQNLHANLNEQSQNSKSIDYYSSNSNSNDSSSNIRSSDDFSSETNSNSTTGGGTGCIGIVSSINLNNNSYTFTNFLNDSNSSGGPGGGGVGAIGFVRMKNNSQTSTTRTRSKSLANNNNAAICAPKSSSTRSSSQRKKSTGGGRKPNLSQNLTPDEELKRAKRRERNKLAAARCRKKRVDQTNTLLVETKDLQKRQDSLIKEIKLRLKEFHNAKDLLESHETSGGGCNIKIRKGLVELFSRIDLVAINAAMERVPDDDIESDLNACYASSSQDEFPPQPSPPKRKRPNSLQINPMISLNNNENAQQVVFNSNNSGIINNIKNESSSTVTNHNNTINIPTNTASLSTPSNGLFGDFGLDLSGLTPINPTITSDGLTPNTMNEFLKSLQSPMDDGREKKKQLLSM